jgi:Protein of unknown function (DUF1565)/Right handed beta helix region
MKTNHIVGRLSALALALAVVSAHATTFYVSTQGSDANPGTATRPFRTITHAYSLASPGTTILVAPGVYTDYTSRWGLHLGASGTAANPIVLQSQVQGAAVIDGQNASDRNVAIYLDGNYNIVDGFEIRNGPNGGISIWGNGNQILNNNIHNNGNPASTSTNGKDGVYSDQNTSGNIYAANYIHDNGRAGSNLDHGLYLCGKNEVVINNALVRNAAAGLQVAGYSTVSNLRVYNNVMAWNGTAGIILWQTLNGVDIENNIIFQNGHYGVGSYAAFGSGVVLDHNLTFGNGYGNYDFTGGGSAYSYTLGAALYTDPLFANETAAGFDAHLRAGSPAIGAGRNFDTLFTTDLAGDPRPASGSWDLGAYVAAVATPPTISGIGDQTLTEGTATGPLSFSVGDAQTAAANLVLSGSSSNPALVPDTAIVFGGSGASRTVTVTPVPTQTGTATVTLQVSDGSLTASTSFTVTVTAGAPVLGGSDSVIWMDDALPAGAFGYADGGDSWNWVTGNPTPYSGSRAHQSALLSGVHDHYFNFATATLTVNTGDELFTYIYLDPANPPSEVMLAWKAVGGTWEHRAYWGANEVPWGTDGSASQYPVGPLPPTGEWVKLSVPASAVGLEGSSLEGMAFLLYNGRATWDLAGKNPAGSSTPPPTTPPPAPAGVTFSAASGVISAPFSVTSSGTVAQPSYTSLKSSGQAVYTFTVGTAGNYLVSALVNAPDTGANSFFVNIDAQPTDPTMIWDVPVTAGLTSQTVSWRGNGGVDSSSPSGLDAQFSPKTFSLSAGTHQLIVRGREGNCQLGAITITPASP